MKEKIKENTNKNKKYKTIILKIDNMDNNNIIDFMSNVKITKIKTNDVIKSIDNLEYLDSDKFNYDEYQLYSKNAKETIIDNYDEYVNSKKYKKTVKYLKDNGISESTINRYIFFIHNYFLDKGNNNDLERLKKTIITLDNPTDLSKFDEKYIEELIDINFKEITLERSGLSNTIYDNKYEDKRNLRCVIKMSEYNPISGGSEFNKIPELFITKKSLLILKNNDNKCFLYCYVRELLKSNYKNRFRITRKDKELANKIINETNLDFENVTISEIDKIEKKLQVNVNVFSCNKSYKNKNIVRKSRTDYDRTLDLLLIEGINHYIIIKNLYFL